MRCLRLEFEFALPLISLIDVVEPLVLDMLGCAQLGSDESNSDNEQKTSVSLLIEYFGYLF